MQSERPSFLAVKSGFGEFPGVPTHHTEVPRGEVEADFVLERLPTSIARCEEDERATDSIRPLDAHRKGHVRKFQDNLLSAKAPSLPPAARNVTCKKQCEKSEKSLFRSSAQILFRIFLEVCLNQHALRIANPRQSPRASSECSLLRETAFSPKHGSHAGPEYLAPRQRGT
jgi:hypothetical protein